MTLRPALGASLALLLGLALATAGAGPASAHNYVVSTSPAEDSVVSEQPAVVSLTTNDALLGLEGSTAVQVVGPDGLHYETSCPTVDGATAGVPAELGPAGEYTVVWQVVSTDGHPIAGEFEFEWAPADGQELATGSDAPACEGVGDAAPASEGTANEGSAAVASVALGDVLWIGGAVIAVIAAGLGTWLVVRRRA